MEVGSINSSNSYWMLTAIASEKQKEKGGSEVNFAELDVNGDGGVDLEESGLAQEEFVSMDEDGDSLLTGADMEARMLAMMQSGQMLPPPMDPSEMIAELDADEDGEVDLEESGLTEELFAALDADGDGAISQTDLEAQRLEMPERGQMPPGGPGGGPAMGASDLLSALDSDDDDQLSLAESGLSSEEFDPLDTNEDGFVSLAELEAAHSSLAAENSGEMAGNGSVTGYALTAYLSQMGATSTANASQYSVSGTPSVNLTA